MSSLGHNELIGGPGGVPMWWVIHMCCGFDPLFSLWQDRARSFWGIFLIHQQQSYLLGYKNYQFLQKSIFLAPNSIFSSIFLGPIFSGQRHTPISFQAEYPPGIGGLPICNELWVTCNSLWACNGWHENFNQLIWIIISAIVLYIAHVCKEYNEMFTYLKGIFSCLGWVNIDFFSTTD